MKRTADEGQVSVLLKDFDDADQLLTRVSSHGFEAIKMPRSLAAKVCSDADAQNR